MGSQHQHPIIVGNLLRAGANPDIALSGYGTIRKMAEMRRYIDVIVVLDQFKCRKLLVELCIGMQAADFPVLVVLEIHNALCALRGLHEAKLGLKSDWQLLPQGHLKDIVSWEIAKKAKHFLDKFSEQ